MTATEDQIQAAAQAQALGEALSMNYHAAAGQSPVLVTR
jgi:hypothetical protein